METRRCRRCRWPLVHRGSADCFGGVSTREPGGEKAGIDQDTKTCPTPRTSVVPDRPPPSLDIVTSSYTGGRSPCLSSIGLDRPPLCIASSNAGGRGGRLGSRARDDAPLPSPGAFPADGRRLGSHGSLDRGGDLVEPGRRGRRGWTTSSTGRGPRTSSLATLPNDVHSSGKRETVGKDGIPAPPPGGGGRRDARHDRTRTVSVQPEGLARSSTAPRPSRGLAREGTETASGTPGSERRWARGGKAGAVRRKEERLGRVRRTSASSRGGTPSGRGRPRALGGVGTPRDARPPSLPQGE
mmetsp:Transcript_13422/g.31708  ORF Transcript_13422/g.31708 Transcript_13422/m.31708 type:complete len:298 (+) Transcript_13422:202-1095(+)